MKVWRPHRCILSVVVLLGLLLAVGCTDQQTPQSSSLGQSPRTEEAKPVVIPDKPTDPNNPFLKITESIPQGEVKGMPQVQVFFDRPIVPLMALDGPFHQKQLALFSLTPAVAGAFRFLGTNAVVFEPDQSIPPGKEYTVTVTKGLRGLDGSSLEKTASFTFQTPRPKLSYVSPCNSRYYTPSDLNPKTEWRMTFNMPMDLPELQKRVQLVRASDSKPVAFTLKADKGNPKAEDYIFRRHGSFTYILKNTDPLELDTEYRVQLAAGLLPEGGSLGTVEEKTCLVRTYSPLRFTELETQEYDPKTYTDWWRPAMTKRFSLNFNNSLNRSSIRNNVSITPKPESEDVFQGGYRNIRINVRALQPKTHYTVTIKAGLKDNHDQSLGQDVTVEFTTGERFPSLNILTGVHVLGTDQPARIPINTVGLSNLKYEIVVLSDKDMLSKEGLDYSLFEQKNWKKLKAKSVTMTLAKALKKSGDGTAKAVLNLEKHLQNGYGAVAYVVSSSRILRRDYSRDKDIPRRYTGLVIRSNLAMNAKITPHEGQLLVHTLNEGTPVEGAEVRFYRRDKQRFCGDTQTDAQGMALMSPQQIMNCLAGSDSGKTKSDVPVPAPFGVEGDQWDAYGPNYPHNLSVLVKQGEDWNIIRLDGTHGSSYDFGAYPQWESSQVETPSVVFSDREIYRPGETVKLKATMRLRSMGTMSIPEGKPVKLYVSDPFGKRTDLPSTQISAYGTFDTSFEIPKDAPLGYYSLEAKIGRYYAAGGFRVAEFRAPDFEAKVTADKPVQSISEGPLKATLSGTYFFGAPMRKAKVEYTVTRSEDSFTPKGLDDFQFGVPGWIRQQKKMDIALGITDRGTETLDANGSYALSIPLNKDEIPFPMRYTVDATVIDPSQQRVSASASVSVLASDALVGLKLNESFYGKDEQIKATVLASDRDGKKLSKTVTVELIRQDWHAMQRQVQENEEESEYTLVETVVATCQADTKGDTGSCSLKPDKAGSYLVKAYLPEAKLASAVATDIYVSGYDLVAWRDSDQDTVEVKLDKSSYQAGETMKVFVSSPYPQSRGVLTVERDRFLYRKPFTGKGGALLFDIPVTEAMIPGASVGVILVRQGAPASGKTDDKDHRFKIGYQSFSVSLNPKRLAVTLTPDKEVLSPRETVNVEIEVKDAAQNPAACEVTLWAVDESVLRLTNYQTPDLLGTFYSNGTLSTHVADTRTLLIERTMLEEKGEDGGGGGMEDAMAMDVSGVQVRRKFLRLAYYNPRIEIAAGGKATVQIEVPDNLTRWRLMAVAVGKDHRFGKGESAVTVNKPLVSRAVAPRFARLGDTFKMGITLQTAEESHGQAKVRLTLDNGKILSFAKQDKPFQEQTISLNAGETKKITFDLTATALGEAVLKAQVGFSGEARGKKAELTDGLEMKLLVQPLPATETVVAVGEVGDKPKKEQILKDAKVDPNVGSLTLRVSPTALENIQEGMDYLVSYPYGCLEQRLSRIYPMLLLEELTKTFGFTMPKQDEWPQIIKTNLWELRTLQNTDGGFRLWKRSAESLPHLSGYAAVVLARAKAQGYDVPQDMLDKLTRYLQRKRLNGKSLAHYEKRFGFSWATERNLMIQEGLTALGKSDDGLLGTYYPQRARLAASQWLKLGLLMSHDASRYMKEITTLWQTARNSITVTALKASLEAMTDLPGMWSFLSSNPQNTAMALQLILRADPKNDIAPKLARWLMDARNEQGHWGNTYGNARVLAALLDFVRIYEKVEPNYTAKVLLAAKQVLSADFKGRVTKPAVQELSMKDIPNGQNEIVMHKQGVGNMYYTLRMRYRLTDSPPVRNQGFVITHDIRPAGKAGDKPKAKQEPGVTQLKLGELAEVTVRLLVGKSGYHVAVRDPLPAGLEPVDATLATTGSNDLGADGQAENMDSLNWYNPFYYTERRDSGVNLFATWLPAGVYTYTYKARATTVGTFAWPGAKVERMYEPEEFGRSYEGVFLVTE